jgi:enhancing lycopene biosynthesis protein 2
LALSKAQAKVIVSAPDRPQMHVINHLTGQPDASQTRNILVESARIARGEIVPLHQLNLTEIDAIILPGGFGAAKNLCNFAVAGENMQISPDVEQVLQAAHQAGKPLGFICISPVIATKLFGKDKVEFTIGNDDATSTPLQKSGARHHNCAVSDIVVDQRLKIVSTPAYMITENLSEIEVGITKLVEAVIRLA